MDPSIVEKRESYENSTKLRNYSPDRYPGVHGCSASLLEEMKLTPGLFPQRPSDVRKLRHHVLFFVVNLFHVYHQDPSRWVSFSRNRNTYTGKKSEYKHKFKLSYEYVVNKVIKFFLGQQYIEQSPFIHHPDPTRSRQSRIRATQKLVDLLRQHEDEEQIPAPLGGEDAWGVDAWENDTVEEIIIVKGLKPKPKWVERMVDGVKSRIKIKPRRKICQTPDTLYVRQLRDKLQKINAVMDETEITLDISQDELKQLNRIVRGDKQSGTSVIDFTRKRLHRVFVDRRLDRGGRFYGPWYQGIPKEYRERILINGVPVLEPDFSGYHPRMLYALKGLPLPEDPYRLQGFPETDEMRKFLKVLLLSMVNAKDERDAITGMRYQRYKDAKRARRLGKELAPLGIEPLTDEKYRKIMSPLMHKHKPIREFFFSELGSYLQYLDSQIAETIMLYFAEKGDACLPVHDSFIIDFRLGGVLTDLMEQLFVLGLKQPVQIKSNLMQLAYRGNFRLDLLNEKLNEVIAQVLEDAKTPEGRAKMEEWEKENKSKLEASEKWLEDFLKRNP